MDRYLFSKVEGMLNWKGAMDQKQDEVDQKLDETMASISQLQSCMNKLIAMHKPMEKKTRGHYVCGWQLSFIGINP
jgi:hypothetical protein